MKKFDLFIESLRLTPKSLKIIQDRYKNFLDIFTVYFPTDKTIKLVSLKASKKAPKGTGTSFMNELAEWADKNGIDLVLDVAKRGDFKHEKNQYKQTFSKNRLIDFYSRFGFVPVKNNSLGDMLRIAKI